MTISLRGMASMPVVIGPVRAAANWADFNVVYDVPEYGGQFYLGLLGTSTTIATQAANYWTISAQKVANSGSGAATTQASYTNNSSGGAAVTANARNAMTNASLTARTFYGQQDAPTTTDRNLLRVFFDAATGAVAGFDDTHQLTVTLRILYGGATE